MILETGRPMRLPLSMKQKNNHLSQAALHKKSDWFFAAALCVEMTVKRRESSVTQRTAERPNLTFCAKHYQAAKGGLEVALCKFTKGGAG